jgi:DNA-binding XRE family transcriptional regulator
MPNFGEDLRLARERSRLLQATLASEAGSTVTIINAIELGHIQPTRVVYDAMIRRFPALRKHRRPTADPPMRQTQPVHAAVTLEYQRTAAWRVLVKSLNVGPTHKGVVAQMVRLAIAGQVREEDVGRDLDL